MSSLFNIIIAILIVITVISKELFVINEETVLLFTFLVFITYAYNYLKKGFAEELDTVRNDVMNELSSYVNNYKKGISLLIDSYKKNRVVPDEYNKLAYITNIYLNNQIEKLYANFTQLPIETIEQYLENTKTIESQYKQLITSLNINSILLSSKIVQSALSNIDIFKKDANKANQELLLRHIDSLIKRK